MSEERAKTPIDEVYVLMFDEWSYTTRYTQLIGVYDTLKDLAIAIEWLYLTRGTILTEVTAGCGGSTANIDDVMYIINGKVYHKAVLMNISQPNGW